MSRKEKCELQHLTAESLFARKWLKKCNWVPCCKSQFWPWRDM